MESGYFDSYSSSNWVDELIEHDIFYSLHETLTDGVQHDPSVQQLGLPDSIVQEEVAYVALRVSVVLQLIALAEQGELHTVRNEWPESLGEAPRS